MAIIGGVATAITSIPPANTLWSGRAIAIDRPVRLKRPFVRRSTGRTRSSISSPAPGGAQEQIFPDRAAESGCLAGSEKSPTFGVICRVDGSFGVAGSPFPETRAPVLIRLIDYWLNETSASSCGPILGFEPQSRSAAKALSKTRRKSCVFIKLAAKDDRIHWTDGRRAHDRLCRGAANDGRGADPYL
jgi:hypothetical protein